jgi:hypothetical protein
MEGPVLDRLDDTERYAHRVGDDQADDAVEQGDRESGTDDLPDRFVVAI